MLIRIFRRLFRPFEHRVFALLPVLQTRVTYCLDRVCVWGTQVRRSENRILIVRLDAIGDFILWLDYAQDFRRLYPQSALVLVANATWSDVAQRVGYWDEIISVDLNQFAKIGIYRFKLLRSIKRGNFQTAIQPTYSRYLLLGDAVVRASRAVQRIGAEGDLTNMPALEKPLSDRCYTRLLPSTTLGLMELSRNAEFIRLLSGEARQTTIASIPHLGFLRRNLVFTAPYFVVFPGASAPIRQWPIMHFADIARRIADKYQWDIVLCGGPNERLLCETLEKTIGRACTNLAGHTALWELIEVVRCASFLIGNETSATHIAAAVGIPSVCVLGGGHFGRFVPYQTSLPLAHPPVAAVEKMDCFNCDWHCTKTHETREAVPCIASIRVENTISAVDVALSH